MEPEVGGQKQKAEMGHKLRRNRAEWDQRAEVRGQRKGRRRGGSAFGRERLEGRTGLRDGVRLKEASRVASACDGGSGVDGGERNGPL